MGHKEATMEALPRDAALVIIDVQQGFGDPAYGRRNNPAAEANAGRLLDQGLSPVAGVRIKNETARSNIVSACQHRRYRQDGRAL